MKFFSTALKSHRMAAVPVPCGLQDGAECAVARPPAECALRLLRGRNEPSWVAAAARLFHGRDCMTGNAARLLDHLAYGKTLSAAEVEGGAFAAAQQVFERKNMRLRQIAHMDVVADTGAVGRWVVRPNTEISLRCPFATCRTSGMRWVSGKCASPSEPSGCARRRH